MPLKPYEIAILLQMYNEQIIGHRGYTSLQIVRSKINWKKISSYYRIRESFDSITRRLVKRGFLNDDGKSLAVLFLDKFGVDFVKGYLIDFPNAQRDLAEIISGQKTNRMEN